MHTMDALWFKWFSPPLSKSGFEIPDFLSDVPGGVVNPWLTCRQPGRHWKWQRYWTSLGGGAEVSWGSLSCLM